MTLRPGEPRGGGVPRQHDRHGGLLRTGTRPTLNLLLLHHLILLLLLLLRGGLLRTCTPPPRIRMSINLQSESCSDLDRVLVLTDPLDRHVLHHDHHAGDRRAVGGRDYHSSTSLLNLTRFCL